jgi:hypothetical protein
MPLTKTLSTALGELTSATSLDRTETLPIVQGGTAKKTTIASALGFTMYHSFQETSGSRVFTVTGAAVNDMVIVTVINTGHIATGYVSATNEVSTVITTAEGVLWEQDETFNILVIHFP